MRKAQSRAATQFGSSNPPCRRVSRILCRVHLRSILAFLLALASLVSTACAQSFPTKPIRLVIGSFPGGGIDLAGRIIAQKMSENMGQQVIVDNRGGANGIIGMETVAKASPDGYTLYMGTAGHISVNPVMYSKLPFNVD